MGNKSCSCGRKLVVIITLIPPDSYNKEDIRKSIEDIERETSILFDMKGFDLQKSLCDHCHNNRFNLRKSALIVRGWKVNTSYIA